MLIPSETCEETKRASHTASGGRVQSEFSSQRVSQELRRVNEAYQFCKKRIQGKTARQAILSTGTEGQPAAQNHHEAPT